MDRAAFRIQLAIDGSEHALAGVQLVRALRLASHDEVILLGVLTPGRPPAKSGLEAAFAQAEEILRGSAVQITSQLLEGHAARMLVEHGRQHRPDLMVIGAKGVHPLLKILLGGTAHQVVERASWPVVVMRTPYRGLRRVLLATDGSENARKALEYLATLPLPEETELQVLHVKPLYPPMPAPTYGTHPVDPRVPYMSSMLPSPAELEYVSRHAERAEEKGQTILAEAKNVLEGSARRVTTFLGQGDPATEILKHSEEQEIDLVVVGPRGSMGTDAWAWDSVSRKLLEYAGSSILFVR
jgi:nucleotide-binding universal stress UspA family protein